MGFRYQLLTGLALAGLAAAQDLRWNMPVHGAAVYERTWQQEVQDEPRGSQSHIPGLDEVEAPCVLADELDDKRQRPTEPIHRKIGRAHV